MKGKNFDFAEGFIQGYKLFEFIQKTVKSQKLEKLNRKQLRGLVIKKWKEIKKRDGIELSKKSERIIIGAATNVFSLAIKKRREK